VINAQIFGIDTSFGIDDSMYHTTSFLLTTGSRLGSTFVGIDLHILVSNKPLKPIPTILDGLNNEVKAIGEDLGGPHVMIAAEAERLVTSR
jgi:hypothetical protein